MNQAAKLHLRHAFRNDPEAIEQLDSYITFNFDRYPEDEKNDLLRDPESLEIDFECFLEVDYS